ncbi:MAG: CHAT domain-containing protein [Saprospiraceae bacterium]
MLNVLFLTFANHPTNPLPTLQAEDDALYRALSPRALQLHYLLHRDSHATIASIARDLQLYRDYVTVFHYSGHAGRDALLTIGGAAQSEGVAQLLAQCRQLKFVVLNGCSTEGQVQRLLELGVPAVVATSAPVDDNKAAVFAQRLYEGLAQQSSLREAFDFAKAEVLANDRTVTFGETRGLALRDAGSDAPCWGLFYKEEKAWVLDEKLPALTLIPKPQNYEPNVRLENALWEALQKNSLVVQALVQIKELQGETMGRGEMRIHIVNNLPAPVAEHLRKLLVPVTDENQGEGYDKIGPLRLKQIARTYEFTLRLVTYTLLAQLWEALLDPDKKAKASPEERAELQRFMRMTATMQDPYNYLDLIRHVRELLDKNQVAYFVEELPQLRQLMEENESFRSAIFFLELLRAKVRENTIHPYEWTELCIRAEECLADFFRELGFLARYVLTSVQNIDVAKYRHEKQPMFVHQIVQLSNLLGKFDRSMLRLATYTDNRSVLLRRIGKKGEAGDARSEGFLNLSPFVIDENAFEDNTDVAKIFFYNNYDPGQDAYVYRFVNKPDDRLVVEESEKRIGILKIQLDAFLRLLAPEATTA